MPVSPAFLRTLADVGGPAHCLTGADRGVFVVQGRTPCPVVFPGTADEAGRGVAAAAAAEIDVIPRGGGTQLGLGAPSRDGALVVAVRRPARILEFSAPRRW